MTRISIVANRWHINDRVTYSGARAEGLLMNVRMINAVFEDAPRSELNPDDITTRFIAQIPDYVAHGIRAFTIGLQGGFPGYEGAHCSAFAADGSLRASYLTRVQRVIEAADRAGAAIILSCYYQRQDQNLRDWDAIRAGVVNVVNWITTNHFANILLETTNEFTHAGFTHTRLMTPEGQVELIQLAKQIAPNLLVSVSGCGDALIPDPVGAIADFILFHLNRIPLDEIPAKIAALERFGKALVCNEDRKIGKEGARAAEICAANGASWGLMAREVNQYNPPFRFEGHKDDPIVYAKLNELTTASRGFK
jgi:hypothetical protein